MTGRFRPITDALAPAKASTRAHGPGGPGVRAFSLLEMMIAMVILGLGMVMVATMFPAAWTRARDLAEYTTQAAITESAHTTIKMLARVDGPGFPDAGSFAGDLIFDGNVNRIRAYGDTRVHALHLENVLISPRRFTPNRDRPWLGEVDTDGENPPWRLEMLDRRDGEIERLMPLDDRCTGTGYCDPLFLSTQIRFGSRVHPPLEPRDSDSYNKDGVFDDTITDPAWDEALDARRFAWAVFHRRIEPGLEDLGRLDAESAEKQVARERVFDMYYATLRRTQSTHRYAQQDPSKVPDPGYRLNVVTPASLPPERDVMLPTPWRVQVFFPGKSIVSNIGPTAIPTVIEVNTTNVKTDEFVVEMFPRGAQLIDEVNGQVYRVIRQRIQAGTTEDEAYLTLDREVFIEDLDDSIDSGENGVLEPDEQVRCVWVFPPPVAADRPDDVPVFVGKQPLVGIDVRTLTISPRE